MIFNKSNLYIESDFEIRIVRETGNDLDIIIPLSDRTLNLYSDDEPGFLKSRLQFLTVKNILIRLCKFEDNNVATIHLLRNIDLKSSVVNFEMDYSQHYIELKDRTFFIELKILRK